MNMAEKNFPQKDEDVFFQHSSKIMRPAPKQEDDIFRHWIEVIQSIDKRLYYRDQSPKSFAGLCALARSFSPTCIVELGTERGLSLRAWIMAAPQARIHAVDLSFARLRDSMEFFPFEASVQGFECDILNMDFAKLWNTDDRVLFFVDAHDMPGVPIMDYVLQTALPHLPEGSLVVVDDMWYSPETVDADNAHRLYDALVRHDVDELLPFDAYYAPYHDGGSFFGFREVKPLLRHINRHGIPLKYNKGCKNVSFYTGKSMPDSRFDDAEFMKHCGEVSYHPLHSVEMSQTDLPQEILRDYADGKIQEALAQAAAAHDAHSGKSDMRYPIAVMLIRQGKFRDAKKILETVIAQGDVRSNTKRLYDDLLQRFFPLHHEAKTRRKPGLTLFTAPKAFIGKTAVQQKNAISSWLRMTPKPEVLVFGDDPGIAEAAAQLDVRHISAIRTNEYNTPLVHDLFQQAHDVCETELLGYINTDIILFSTFMPAVLRGAEAFERFIMVGGRWDYEQDAPVDFTNPAWEEFLLRIIWKRGVPHNPTGMDYFVFRPHKAWSCIPPFALGRFTWDSWLLSDALAQGMTVIDATEFVHIGHQNHAYAWAASFTGAADMRKGPEARRNLRLAGQLRASSVLETPYRFDAQGLIHKRNAGARRRNLLQSLDSRHSKIRKR